jgi:hypothetical protein
MTFPADAPNIYVPRFISNTLHARERDETPFLHLDFHSFPPLLLVKGNMVRMNPINGS